MDKPKVLMLYTKVLHYRVPTWRILAEYCDLTLTYFEGKAAENVNFRQIKLDTVNVGPFTFVKGALKMLKDYDVVVTASDFHVPTYSIVPFLPHKNGIVHWSIGYRVSYEHPYIVDRKHVFLDWLYLKCLKACDADVFYMDKAKEFWRNTSLDMDRVFIAPNTTDVVYSDVIDESKKKDFLFVGTLYKGKGLDVLLNSYCELFRQRPGMEAKLHIVGEGAEREIIEAFIKKNGLEGRVVLHGGIYEESKLAELFAKSILCISPNQAGLSAPKSMGYGVTFVTRKDAITGGEIYHISPGVNGIVYEKDEDLLTTMVDAVDNPDKYQEMGRKAREYYLSNATPKHMAQGLIDAIDFVLKSK